jgi:hypothetical protein
VLYSLINREDLLIAVGRSLLHMDRQNPVPQGSCLVMNQIQDDTVVWGRSEAAPKKEADMIDSLIPKTLNPTGTFRCLIESQRLAIYVNDQQNEKNALRRRDTTRNAEPRKIIKPERELGSLNDLATFLLTKDPPPENFMSMGDTTEQVRPQRKLPFKFLQRQDSKKVKECPPQLLLPDSAVAARTIQGHWHIAITIPPEYDPLLPRPGPVSQEVQLPPKESISIDCDGPITVLKPAIMENRPMRITRVDFIAPSDSTNNAVVEETPRSTSRSIPDSVASKAESPKIMQNSCDRESVLGVSISAAGTIPLLPRPREPRGETRVMSPVDAHRSRWKKDSRNSNGTTFSGRSIQTTPSHSRDSTSISTAPDESFIRSPAPSIRSVTGSLESDVSSIHAKMADMSNVTGSKYTSIRNTSGICGPPPNRKLPELPEGTSDRRPRVTRKIPATAEPSPLQYGLRDVAHGNSDAGGSQRPYIQSRQERVKALRSRDMAALRTSVDQHVSESDGKHQRESLPIVKVFETRKGKQRATSRRVNSLTPIMVVVDTEPVLNCQSPINYAFPSPPRNASKPFESSKAKSSADMKRMLSYPVRISMSDDKVRYSPQHRPAVTALGRAQVASPVTPSHTEPRLQPSPTSSLDSIEVRLKNIEHSNALLLRALNAVVRMGVGYCELKDMVPSPLSPSSPSTTRGIDAKVRYGTDGQAAEDLGNIEPLMRELQEAARVSLEDQRGVSKDLDECDDMF